MLRRTTAVGFSLTLLLLAVRGEGSAAPVGEKPVHPPRVLLFASSATREYQFLRALLVRESEAKRVDLSIHLQPPPGKDELRSGIAQDVPRERLLGSFPTRLDAYDVIVAFDPDWTRLSDDARTALHKWVSQHGGGLVLIAGPINTMQLAGAAQEPKLAPVLDLYPIILQDPRRLESAVETSKPRRLSFPTTKAKYTFLKLDPRSQGDQAGWQEFFDAPRVKQDNEPRHGFFSYSPVESVKPDAIILATLADPKIRLKDGKDQPYLVTWQVGKGRVLYLGSGELWRLRPYRAAYYERLWLGLLGYMSDSRAR